MANQRFRLPKGLVLAWCVLGSAAMPVHAQDKPTDAATKSGQQHVYGFDDVLPVVEEGVYCISSELTWIGPFISEGVRVASDNPNAGDLQLLNSICYKTAGDGARGMYQGMVSPQSVLAFGASRYGISLTFPTVQDGASGYLTGIDYNNLTVDYQGWRMPIGSDGVTDSPTLVCEGTITGIGNNYVGGIQNYPPYQADAACVGYNYFTFTPRMTGEETLQSQAQQPYHAGMVLDNFAASPALPLPPSLTEQNGVATLDAQFPEASGVISCDLYQGPTEAGINYGAPVWHADGLCDDEMVNLAGLVPEGQRAFFVGGVSNSQGEAWSSALSYTAPVVVKAPGNVTGFVLAEEPLGLSATWSAPAVNATHDSASAYHVTVSCDGVQHYQGDTTETKMIVGGLPADASCSLGVAAYNTGGAASGVSGTASPLPTSPSDPQLVATGGDHQVALSWSAPQSPDEGHVAYDVSCGPAGQNLTLLATGIGGTSYTASGLNAATTYDCSLQAYNRAAMALSRASATTDTDVVVPPPSDPPVVEQLSEPGVTPNGGTFSGAVHVQITGLDENATALCRYGAVAPEVGDGVSTNCTNGFDVDAAHSGQVFSVRAVPAPGVDMKPSDAFTTNTYTITTSPPPPTNSDTAGGSSGGGAMGPGSLVVMGALALAACRRRPLNGAGGRRVQTLDAA